MKGQHTPGPWFVVQGDEWTSDIATETPEQGIWTVASANKRRDEFDANKRLIASAPDLIEALQAMWDTSCTNMHSTPSKAAFLKASKALAKAKGE